MQSKSELSTEQKTKHDPFHLHAAADRVAKRTSAFSYLSGHVVLLLVRFWAFLPWLLLVLLPPLGMTHPNNITITLACLIWMWFVGFLIQNLRLFDVCRTSDASSNPNRRPKVLVIGAGATGIVVVKECLAASLSVRAYERRETFGGVYEYTEKFDGGVWKGCRLTSSPWVTAFSDFPPCTLSDRHLTHDQYIDYLSSYVDHFDLKPHIFFERTVVNVAHHEGGGWNVRVRVGKHQVEEVEHFDYVAICVGSNTVPRDSNIPGMKNFEGDIRKVGQYKRPSGFRGKNVVVVGNGESGTDIATQIAGIASQTYLSIRRGKFIIPRIDQQSCMANDYDTNRLRYASPVVFRNWYMLLVRRLGFLMRTHDELSAIGVQMLEASGIGPMSQLVTKSDDFIEPLLTGRLQVRRELVAFERSMAVFSDGTKEKVDAVVFAHGYEPAFPFLELPKGIAARHPGLLFMRMFLPEVGKSLAFCGFVRPVIGSIPPTSELQARYFAMVASGCRDLPSETAMHADVQKQVRESVEMFPMLQQPNVAVSWIRYLDQIADAIGCRPNPWQLLQHPTLMWKVMTGPICGALYRLHGPGAHRVAQASVLSMKRTHPLVEIMTHVGFHFWFWPYALLQRKITWIQHNTFV